MLVQTNEWEFSFSILGVIFFLNVRVYYQKRDTLEEEYIESAMVDFINSVAWGMQLVKESDKSKSYPKATQQ